jgi:hypothetical protein
VRGSVEFVGDDLDTWGPIRYGFFYHDSAGALKIDSTQATAGVDTTYYNLAWSGKENYAYGYMFSPNSGTNQSQAVRVATALNGRSKRQLFKHVERRHHDDGRSETPAGAC